MFGIAWIGLHGLESGYRDPRHLGGRGAEELVGGLGLISGEGATAPFLGWGLV